MEPTKQPTIEPSVNPTIFPSMEPTTYPTAFPTQSPSNTPSSTASPSSNPTKYTPNTAFIAMNSTDFMRPDESEINSGSNKMIVTVTIVVCALVIGCMIGIYLCWKYQTQQEFQNNIVHLKETVEPMISMEMSNAQI